MVIESLQVVAGVVAVLSVLILIAGLCVAAFGLLPGIAVTGIVAVTWFLSWWARELKRAEREGQRDRRRAELRPLSRTTRRRMERRHREEMRRVGLD